MGFGDISFDDKNFGLCQNISTNAPWNISERLMIFDTNDFSFRY